MTATPEQRSILLIDDDPIMTEMFTEILSSESYQVHIATSVLQAQQILSQTSIHIVISDYHIGIQNADILYAWLQLQQPELLPCFILLTGDKIQDFTHFRQHSTVLYKPIDIEQLLQIINTRLCNNIEASL